MLGAGNPYSLFLILVGRGLNAIKRGGIIYALRRGIVMMASTIFIRGKASLPTPLKRRIRRLKDCLSGTVRRVHQTRLSPGQPLIAVVIPCYNYGMYITEAVESVKAQTLSNVELIVVDDGSTDPLTVQILSELAAKGGVNVIRQPNRGLSAARNTGIRSTSARYIVCLDADDRIEPTYLEKAVAVLESRPDVGIAYSWARLFGDEDYIWVTEPADAVRLLEYNHIPVSAVFRREAWQLVGGFDETMRIGYEDWEFWLRIMSLGYRGWLIPEPLFAHRRHGRTMTHEAQDRHKELSTMIRKRHQKSVLSNHRRRLSEVYTCEAFVNLEAKPKKGKRLLIVVPWLTVGGAESVLYSVVDALIRVGSWEVFISTTIDSPNEWAGKFLNLTPLIYFLPNLFPPRFYPAFLTHLIEQHRIDCVLISHSELGYGLTGSWRKRFPEVALADLLHNDLPEGHVKNSVYEDRFLDCHIAVHETIRKTMVERYGIADEKVHVIWNGADSNRFVPDLKRGKSWLEALGLDPAKPHIGFVGRLSKEKNPELFIRLAASLADLDVEWLVVGSGPQEQAIRLLADKLRAPVRFLGARDDIPEVLQALDVLVVTSSGEGLPIIVIEALLSCVPVVATRVGGIVDLIDEGITGCLVPEGDLHSFASVLRRVVTQGDYRRMRRECFDRRRDHIARFSSSRMAHQYVALLENLVRERTIKMESIGPGVQSAARPSIFS
jgi:glycosyltransferase involved in cell wall biosynthesis